jgi:hypothetical protein
MTNKWIAQLLFTLLLLGNVAAADFPLNAVPDPLKSWVPWVLDGEPGAGCPHLFDDANQRYCAWPGALELKANGRGATFAQDWSAYRETWITLPGDEQHWPLEVSVDGKASAVLSREGKPSIKLTAGSHRVTGRFLWSALPESLALPENAGLLRLELDARAVGLPVRDKDNRLWLQSRIDAEGEEEAQVRVYRKISDGVPITVETRIRLEVSGKSREISIGRALLSELIPQELASPLPATLAQDGSLKVQARAGTWDITFIARHPGPVKTLKLPAEQGLFAPEEVWVYQAAPLIRSASIDGAATVDPQQTTLPAQWRNLPSYLMRPDSHFSFKEIRRGDSEPAPDKLALERRLWLSFDGSALTMSDRVQGEISRASRLVMNEPVVLGRVDIDGQDQLVTRGSDGLAGIEVKRGKFAMTADSLVPGAPRRLPAIGWKHDFDRLAVTLALPAGWRLLHAGGADRADGAWLSQWDLLDFFLVLVIALAAGQLWGIKWGMVALAALVLSYQEPGAPSYEWIVLLAAVALHRALPAGRFKSGADWLQRIGLLALVLMTLGFATHQVRSALYPVLENRGSLDYGLAAPAYKPEPLQAETPASVPARAPVMAEADQALNKAEMPVESATGSPARMKSLASKPTKEEPKQRQRAYRIIDPEAKVQTGPGLPDWRWHAYRLTWDGPVRQDQPLDLWLLSPTANRILVMLRLTLLALLLACVSGLPQRWGRPGSGKHPRSPDERKPDGFGRNAGIVLLVSTLVGGATLHSPAAQAALPDQERLGELKEKLTRAADCLPECADISRLSVQVHGSTLRLGLDVDAAIDTALPLPGGARHWLPSEALIDGKAAFIQRDPEGGLWLLTPAGRHRVELNGDMTARDILQLPLPRKPRRVDVSADGWDVAGLSDESGAADTLQLSRRVKANNSAEAPVLPPFLRVERRLILDLVWRIETTVRRDSPPGVPALVQIPLLPGEAVTTSGVNVKDGKVLVNLGPQAESLSWSSNLTQRPELTLVAPKDSAWVETWVIATSSLWHVNANGIPPVAMDANEDADLAFRPWPGETLALKIERPQAIAGQTLTIDNSNLIVTPGTRATDYQLHLTVRSSRGVDHAVTLPEGASLQRVSINGQPRPIRASGSQVVVPLTPGRQIIDIVWRADQGMLSSYSTLRVGLNQESVNSRIKLNLPHDRWLLLASGPGIGPAILFWGKLLILLAIAIALGRFSGLPIRTRQWVLLALGLTQVSWWAGALVIAWFFAFSLRGKALAESCPRWLFNLRQLALIALTVALLSVLFSAVQGGLLGQPEMQVAGNNSSYNQLNWYLDRADAELQGAWVLTLPILVYRGLMLVWALWLAWSLLAWLKWGWNAFGNGALWRHKPKVVTGSEAAVQPLDNDLTT